jgi:hypothetical protein
VLIMSDLQDACREIWGCLLFTADMGSWDISGEQECKYPDSDGWIVDLTVGMFKKQEDLGYKWVTGRSILVSLPDLISRTSSSLLWF